MKMPNDIFVEQKKICGILTNMITTGGAFDPDGSPWWWGSNRAKNEEVSLLVVGVGVNTWYQEKENRFECSNLFDCISSGENFEEPSSREERIKQLGDNLHTEIGIAMPKWLERLQLEGKAVVLDLVKKEDFFIDEGSLASAKAVLKSST
eukprot:Trichotokara_eunicae@DN6226_c0_g1_i7.p1